MVNIVIWNARGIKEKREEMIKNIKECDIFAITESKIDEHYHFTVGGYDTVRLDSIGNNSGGIIIFIASTLKYKTINLNLRNNIGYNYNCDVIGISIDNIDLDLIIVYRKPYGTTHKSLWENICRVGKSRKNTIIAGDFNSHHTAWNCASIDKNGENLLQTMTNSNFFCVNRDTMTRINNPYENASNIDLIFASSAALKLISYKQLEDSWDSDHFPLLIEFRHDPTPYIKKSNRMSTKCTDWEVYTDLTNSMLSDTKTKCEREGRNLAYTDLMRILYDAINIASGRKKDHNTKKNKSKIFKKNPVKWWDRDCKAVVSDKKEKLKAYRSDGSQTAYIEYKRSCAIAKKTIKAKKRESFRNFCNSINR